MEIFVTEKSNIWEYLKVTTRQIRVHNIFYGIRTHNQDITSKKIMGWYLQYDAMSMCKVSVTSSHLERHRVFFRRRHWHPTPVFLPGKSHGERSLVGCSPWGREVGHNWATSLSLFIKVATHSSVLAWRIPGTVEPGGLPSTGSHRVRHD